MSNGKGSAPRNCFSPQYRANYDHIFRRAAKPTGINSKQPNEKLRKHHIDISGLKRP